MDPESQQINISVKVTIPDSPESSIIHFCVQGKDAEGFLMADLYMHAMLVEAGKPSTCTKRFEMDVTRFRQVRSWQLAEVTSFDATGMWMVKQVKVKGIPNSHLPDVGNLLFRVQASFVGKGRPRMLPIQGIDKDGFEVCHFLLRGDPAVQGNQATFEGSKRVYRPRDFQDFQGPLHWRSTPIKLDSRNLNGFQPWNDDS